MRQRGRRPGQKAGQGRFAGKPLRDDLPTLRIFALSRDRTLQVPIARLTFPGDQRQYDVMIHARRAGAHPQPAFVCPSCGAEALVLRLLEGRPVCIRCDGLAYRSRERWHTKEATRANLARLEARAAKDGRGAKKAALTLQRALILIRRRRLFGLNAGHAQ